MNPFSAETKAAYPELSLDVTEQRIDELFKRKVRESDGYLLSPGSMLPAMVHDLIQCGLWRTLELTDVAIREINEQRPMTACVLVRAAFETACLVQDAALKSKAVADSGDIAQLPELELHLKRAVAGGGSKEFRISDLDALRIGRAIERVSNDLDIENGIPQRMYNLISEFAHPNYPGMLANYTEVGKPKCITTFTECRGDQRHGVVGIAVGTLGTTLDVLDLAFKGYADFIGKLVVLSEKWNYEGGKWPPDLPYPIPR